MVEVHEEGGCIVLVVVVAGSSSGGEKFNGALLVLPERRFIFCSLLSA